MLEIINQKYMNFLFEISKGPKNVSDLAKKGDLVVSVASGLISRWERSGVVNKEKAEGQRGREIIITLTEYGKAQVKLLKEISRNYKRNKEQMNKQEITAVSLVSDPKPGCVITKIEKGGVNGTGKN